MKRDTNSDINIYESAQQRERRETNWQAREGGGGAAAGQKIVKLNFYRSERASAEAAQLSR